jgi:predicted NBD/HSP70 family sugar kinase
VAGEGAVVEDALKRGASNVAALDAVIEAAKLGDKACRDATATSIGIALASTINLLNPDLIVLAGRFASAGDFLTGPVREELDKRCWLSQRSTTSR